MTKRTLFRDDFRYLAGQTEPQSAVPSYLFPDDPYCKEANALWQEPGGSASGFPFWTGYDDYEKECYLTESRHASTVDPEQLYYYSGIMIKQPLTLSQGHVYTMVTDWYVNEWYSYRIDNDPPELGQEGCRINKIEVGLRLMGYPSVSWESAFECNGGSVAIRVDDGRDSERTVTEVGWDVWPTGDYLDFLKTFRGDYHRQRQEIRLTAHSLGLDFYLYDHNGEIYQKASRSTSDPEVMRALTKERGDALFYISVPQIKGRPSLLQPPYIQENVKLLNVVIEEGDL